MSQINLGKCFDIYSEMSEFRRGKKGYTTKAITAGQSSDKWASHANVPPIHLCSTYNITDITEIDNMNWIHSRYDNPSRSCLEECLASLDDAEYCVTYGSAVGALTTLLLTLKTGDHILLGSDLYGGYCDLIICENLAKNMGIEYSFVNLRDLDLLKKSIKPNTTMIIFDTPSNPLLRVFDIKAISKIIHDTNRKIIVVVDNTFITPYFMHPLELGADIALYSLTKYLNGHADVVMGAMTTNNNKLYAKLKSLQKIAGVIPSPFDCYLVMCGLNTLPLRMQQHFKNGLIVAKFLNQHPAVEKVIHPGLSDHPDHALAVKQASGHSGMLCFYLRNASSKDIQSFLSKLKMIRIAESLGDLKSGIYLASLIPSTAMSVEEKEALGITNNLLRLSVGAEDPEDIVEDLNQALNQTITYGSKYFQNFLTAIEKSI
uniref:cystathionine gamma-lyase n=1 Tax=Culicoides sonorensis TaxID=179676 RepID=A0A336M1T0_CULSO